MTHSIAKTLVNTLVIALALSACNIPTADTGIESGVTAGDTDTDTEGGATSVAETADASTGMGQGSDSGGDSDSDSGTTTGGDGCDFEAAIQPIFSSSCALAGCHAGDSPQMGMSLEPGSAYAALVGVNSQETGTPRVTPGDLDASFLWEKLGANPSAGSRMPLGGQLNADELARIESWILAGAPETEPFLECDEGADVAAVELVGDVSSVQVGELVTLEAVALDGEGQPLDVPITWTSALGERLFIDRDGVGLGVSPGSVEVIAAAGGVESAPVVIEVLDHDPPPAAFVGGALPVFTGSCALAGCHVDGVETGDLRFDRDPDRVWEKLVHEPSEEVPATPRVTPNDPLRSYVLLKIVQRAPAVGGQMPLGGAPLDADKAQVILRWILDGAPFN